MSLPLGTLNIYSGVMTRNIYNWTYRDVTQFLKDHGFEYYKAQRGSHQLWIKYGEDATPDPIVEINFTTGSYPPKTLKTMIKQYGISQSDWISWANA